MAITSAPSGVGSQACMVSRPGLLLNFTKNTSSVASLSGAYVLLKRAKPSSFAWTPRQQSIMMATPNQGGGVLDRPAVLPGYDKKREYVVRVLMKVVDGLTVDDAVNVMQEAHINGMACVIECAQEDAERYCEGLRGNGLMASVEPAGGGGDSKPSD